MKKIILCFVLCFVATSSFSQTQIAACENPKGYIYYPHIYPVPKNKSGWVQDAITGGKSIFVKKSDGKYDLLFIDSMSKKPISSIDDGGKVILLRKTNNQITVLIDYELATEVYSYWRTDDGQLQYSIVQSKGGTISKSGAMIGTCQFINFNF
jgi:hypothetical protein